jgi:hypothetical protein
MGTVVQKFDADASAVERELAKMRREYDKLLQKMDAVAKQSQRDRRLFNIDLTAQIRGLAQMAAGYFSLQSAAALFNAELTRRIDLEKRLSDKTISVAASQAQVRKMIGNVTTDEFKGFLDQISAIQTQSGFADIGQMNNAAAAILSATGSNQKTTTEILAAVAPVFRDTPDQLAQFAGAVADVMNVTKTDAQSASALALAGLSSARIEQLGGFANVAQAVGSGRTLLGDLDDQTAGEQIIALFGTLSRFSKDKEGGPTRTAAVTLLQKLEQFGGEGGIPERLKAVQEQLAAGRIREADLLSGFEKTSFGAVRDLFRGGDEINQDLLTTISTTKGSVEQFQALVNDLNTATPQLQAAAFGDRIAMATEQAQLGTAGGEAALLAQARQARGAAAAGVNAFTNTAAFNFMDLDRMLPGGFNTPEQQAQRELNFLLSMQRELRSAGDTESANADRQLVRDQIKIVEGIIATLKANARARNASAQSATQTERD